MTKRVSMMTKTEQELSKELADTRALLRVERFAAAGSRPKDPNMPRKHRVTIARILTEQHVRTLRA